MSVSLLNLSAVLLGSAVGGVARYGVTAAVSRLAGDHFPWGTLLVNVSGALLIGVLAAMTTGGNAMAELEPTRLLLITGICGSYTTVSSFSLQTLELIRRGNSQSALANVIASLCLTLTAVWTGWHLTLWLAGLQS